jgi:glutaredoxin-like protein NrdH
MDFVIVDGTDKGKITLYALSTCIWCKKTKELLLGMGIGFEYIYVDLLKGDDRTRAIEEVKRHNSSISFPTLVIGERSIVGYREKEIKEALK